MKLSCNAKDIRLTSCTRYLIVPLPAADTKSPLVVALKQIGVQVYGFAVNKLN